MLEGENIDDDFEEAGAETSMGGGALKRRRADNSAEDIVGDNNSLENVRGRSFLGGC